MSEENIYINTLRIQLVAFSISSAKILINAPCLSSNNVKNNLLKSVLEMDFQQDINVHKIVLNLGCISAIFFETEFNQRLKQSVQSCLAQLLKSRRHKPLLAENTNRLDDLQLLPEKPESDLQSVRSLAIFCLQSPTLSPLLHKSQLNHLERYLHYFWRFNQRSSVSSQATYGHRVTANQLMMAALHYLLHDRQGIIWLSQHFPSLSQLNSGSAAIVNGEITREQFFWLIEGLSPSVEMSRAIQRWLLPLWQRKPVHDAISKRLGRAVAENIDAYFKRLLQRSDEHSQLSQHISNAGVVLLWPLLPQLFSLLALTEEQQFISDNARWQAVLSLDWLVWATAPPVAERLRLNQLLCAIPPDSALPEILPLSEAQQQQIDRWFTAVSQQLPAWQKFSLGDIRQLFLQRPGEIVTDTLPPQILVKPESFDLLLGDWPWPLTMVQLPWLEQPLTLVWPFNGLAG